jgi:ArsR family transcriptional regulator, lead/cadmium/zinc/bismuth-responsive transcriptional repressor
MCSDREVTLSDPAPLDDCQVRMVDPERVAAVQRALPPSQSVASVAEVFALLGDDNRLRLLLGLLEGGELCVCDLAAAAGLGESATSHALRLLRAHRVVKVRRAGRRAYYSLIDGHVRMLLDVAVEHQRHQPPGGAG